MNVSFFVNSPCRLCYGLFSLNMVAKYLDTVPDQRELVSLLTSYKYPAFDFLSAQFVYSKCYSERQRIVAGHDHQSQEILINELSIILLISYYLLNNLLSTVDSTLYHLLSTADSTILYLLQCAK